MPSLSLSSLPTVTALPTLVKPPFALSGSCAALSYLNDVYEPVARTADGRFYYRAQGYWRYAYYDADCSGDGSYGAMWIIDNNEPSTTATS